MIYIAFAIFFSIVSYFAYFAGLGYLAAWNYNLLSDDLRFFWLRYVVVWIPFLILLLILWVGLIKLRTPQKVCGLIVVGYIFLFLVVANPFALNF